MMETRMAPQAGFKGKKRSYSNVITAAQSAVMKLTRRLIASQDKMGSLVPLSSSLLTGSAVYKICCLPVHIVAFA